MDVEDWYHSHFPGEDVDKSVSLLDGLDIVLRIMDREKVKGSFFVVGEIAEKLGDTLRMMDKEGHDIGAHNWEHARPLSMSEAEFKEQLVRTKDEVERVLGHEVAGYRAPCFAIDDKFLEIVKEAGFKYDSSKLKPQKSAKYGELLLPGYDQIFPCVYRKDGFTEFEVSSQKIGSLNMLLGGGYLRMLPWIFIKHMTRKYLHTGKPYVMYIHPIDLSPMAIPKVEGTGLNRYLRMHIGRKHMYKRFEKVIRMLKDEGYEFITFEELRKTLC